VQRMATPPFNKVLATNGAGRQPLCCCATSDLLFCLPVFICLQLCYLNCGEKYS